MKKSRWKIALKTIYELAPYKDPKTAGMTPEDVLSHMRLDFPGITRQGVFSAISGAITRRGAPIVTLRDPKKARGVLYHIPLGARKKTQDILAGSFVLRQVVKKSSHPPLLGAHVRKIPIGAPAQKKSPKTAATVRSENCLRLIQARAPRSLSCEDVADFFFISLEEAAQVLTAAAAKYSHLVEITMHARIKKQ